jgi:cyclohexa-1,5-dienecarbonyl-CoA hydratase
VHGQCLGGGLELALACGRIFAAPAAQCGQPQIKLGVFAPAASALLPYRLNQPDAEDLLLTGRSIDADEALRMRLVQQVSEDPAAAALAWYDQHLHGKSAAALACATVAARAVMQKQVRGRLAELERLYLEWLMRTHDANEGLAAFLEKRQPAWTHQ